MKSTWTTISILAALLIASIFYWTFYSPKEEISERIYKTIKEQEKRADITFKDVTFEEVAAGIKYWELSSKTAMVNKSTSLATLKNAQGTFFKDGKSVLRFRSPAALWDMSQKEILLDKPLGYDLSLESKISALANASKRWRSSVFNLPAVPAKGYWFQANNLSWNLASQKLLCTGGIILNKGETTGYSEKLEGDVALENIIMQGNPKIVIKPEKSSTITLEADLLEIITPEDIIIAQGNPRISWEEATIFAESMKYRQRQKVLALNGSVEINYKDIQGWGDSASYFTEKEIIEIEGRAHAQQGENKLNGEKVLVSLKDKKISVLGGGKVIITEEGLKR